VPEIEKLKKQILLQNPTDEQAEAIFSDELEYLLRASPGSGKTWTSCRRFIWRGSNWSYKVGGLALLSFTNVAIREFHDATIKVGRRDLLSDPNYVGTFDSFVERFIIAPFGHLLCGGKKSPKLFLAPSQGHINKHKLKVVFEKTRPVYAWDIVPFLEDVGDKKKVVYKSAGKTLSSQARKAVQELFNLGYYTHAQRVFLAFKILLERPNIADCLCRRFPEIIVDEAQDTNAWLLVLLNLLREKGTKISLIGDPDQCIYEFSMADATSLPSLKEKWGIPEKPLSRSFRCNDSIARAVRNIGGNKAFLGAGSAMNEYCSPYIFRDSSANFSLAISKFQKLLAHAEICESRAAILCRGRGQIEKISGDANYSKLKGLTKEFATAAFFRDFRHDYNKAYALVEKLVREILDEPDYWEKIDENTKSQEFHLFRLGLWKFIKSPDGLPQITHNGDIWIDQLKTNLSALLKSIGAEKLPKLGTKIKRTGLSADQIVLPLYTACDCFPMIRLETIHQVKGESIDAVLLLGSSAFFNSVSEAVCSDGNTEDRRLAYVGMTRSRHLLMLGLPKTHYDKHSDEWQEWGFKSLHDD
jgi:superfamily I DNA/RNA helicase